MNPRRDRRRLPEDTRPGGDAAFATAELLLGVVLLLIPVSMLVVTFPTWAERRSMAESVAYEAAQTVARSSNWATGKRRAEALVAEMAGNYGLEREQITVEWRPDRGEAPVERGERVRAAVAVEVPAVAFPWGGDAGAWRVTAEKTVTADLYRSRDGG
ncbi:MAG: hypothetical protein ACRDKW_00490 [Actinomycetota bacterium]